MSAEPTPLGVMPGGFSELWSRGNLLFVVPALREEYPEPLIESIACRRALLLGGQCDCGAECPPSALDPAQGNVAVVLHAADCPAEHAERLLAEWVSSGEGREQ